MSITLPKEYLYAHAIHLTRSASLIFSFLLFGAGVAEANMTPPPCNSITVPIIKNRCISLYEDVGEYITTNDNVMANRLAFLSDASDATIYKRDSGYPPSGPIWFEIPIVTPNSNQLILHWRSFSFQNRNNNQTSLQNFKIEFSADNGTTWTSAGTFTNQWRDDYVVFDINPQNKPNRVRVTEFNNKDIKLSRLDVFEKAPNGERDDIWLFIGDSVTKANMSPNENSSNGKPFSNIIRENHSCQYPIVLNRGYGGERATEIINANNANGSLSAMLAERPEVTFVPICYGLNDIMISNLLPYGSNASGTEAYFSAMKTIIQTINGTNCNSGRVAIPSNVPWAFLPNNHCYWCEGNITPFNSGDNGVSGFDNLNQLIQQETPYASNDNGIPLADFGSYFYNHRYDYEVFNSDKLHHATQGQKMFKQIWAEAAATIVYNSQTCSSSNLSIYCPNNIITTTNSNSSISWSAPTTSTSCAAEGINITQVNGQSSGSSFSLGTHTISYTANDACENTANCNFNITVNEVVSNDCGPVPGYSNLGTLNGHGYYLSNSIAPWNQAKTLAENDGGYLVSMNSQEENDFVKNMLSGNLAFIGFNDVQNEGIGAWANGTPVTLDLSFNNSGNKDYAVMNFWAGTWEMEKSGPHRKYIMEKSCGETIGKLSIFCPTSINVTATNGTSIVNWDPAVATTTCSTNNNTSVTQTAGQTPLSSFVVGVHTIAYKATDACSNMKTCNFSIIVSASSQGTSCGTIPGYSQLGEMNNHGYYLSDNKAPWAQAKLLSENDGGYLVSINSQEENNFIQPKLGNNLAFIGFNDIENEGVGAWANGIPVTLDLSFNNSGNKDYAVMNFWAGTWEMEKSGPYRKYILEKNCGTTTSDMTISCPPNIDVVTTNESATVSWSLAVASTTCSDNNINIVQTTGQAPQSSFLIGTHTITYKAKDNCNNMKTCSFTIKVIDNNQGDNCAIILGYNKLGEYNGHGYFLSDNSARWDQAKILAESNGGYLSTISSQAENDFIKNKLGSNMAFIGYNDAQTGNGAWANGEPVTLDLSYNDSPENDYAVMNFWAGTWEMEKLAPHRKYVMEKSCAGSFSSKTFLSSAAIPMSIYPNPAYDFISTSLSVEEDVSVTFTIFNAEGRIKRIVRKKLLQGANEFKFEIQDLNPGLYFVRVRGFSVKHIAQFVKSKN